MALSVVQEVAQRVAAEDGAALFVDYGLDRSPTDSARGFRNHKVVELLSEPGLVDVTADVVSPACTAQHTLLTARSQDFAACASVARTAGAAALPLQSQGRFLMSMGAAERLDRLINLPSTSDEQAQRMFDGFKFLVAPDQMGVRFKALCVCSPNLSGKIVGFSPPS